MRKTIIIIISILFFVNRDKVIMSGITAINIWSNTLFPLLFPTFIINDLLLSTNIRDNIIKILGPIYSLLFNLPKEGSYVFIMALISGTPSNAKNLSEMVSPTNITNEDITRILCTCYFYNPLFIISYTNMHTLISIILANIITSFILKSKVKRDYEISNYKRIPFNLSKSIENNIHILLNILGTVTVFLIISSLIPIDNVFIKTLISGILELTTGLNLLSSIKSIIIIYKIILSIILSFGGLSIFYQIKSILKDTSIDYKYYIKNRLLCSIVLMILL